MKHSVKYSIVFVLAFLLSWVISVQLIDSQPMMFGVNAAFAVLVCFLLRKTINNYKFSFILLVSVFLFVLIIPLAGKKETDSLEKRSLGKFPTFDINYIWGFTYGFADYFNDRFAFRNASIAFLGKLKYKTFRESPMPNLVEVGKDNFLFYCPFDYIESISAPFTKEQLDTIKTNLEIMTKWFDEKGIKYYITVPPVKEHVYAELMSQRMQTLTSFSRLNQVYDYIKDDTLIRIINYRKELTEGKKIRNTYLETDTHWNKYGAFIAYTKIMNRIHNDFPDLKPEPISNYVIDSSFKNWGDLGRHLGFNDILYSKYYELKRKSGEMPVAADSAYLYDPDIAYNIRLMPGKKSGLKLFVIRDSFSDALMEFLSPHFSRSIYAWTKIPPTQVILKEKPDIVIHELLERFLDYTLHLPDEIKNANQPSPPKP